jgi:hypothetical protein
VMWAVKRPFPFDEDSVGVVRLVLEKGRRGGLPPSVTFSVVGGEGGFMFARSQGTIELEDDDGLTPSAKKALESLEAFGEDGATWKEWWDDSLIESKATFNKARNELLASGLVEQREPRYFVTGGGGLLRSNRPKIDLDRPSRPRRGAQTDTNKSVGVAREWNADGYQEWCPDCGRLLYQPARLAAHTA